MPFIAYETGKASIENAFSNMRNEEYSKLYDEITRQGAELGRYKNFVYNSLDELEGDGRYMNLVTDNINTRLEFEREKAKKNVAPNSFGMKLYTEGQKDIVDALNGLDGSNLALAKKVFGVGESIPVMAASVVNPYLGVTVSGMKTSADKMYELNMAGVPAGESFRRGAAVGAIDAGASYLPSKYFHGAVRGQGRSLADSALRQANVTALEELTNYTGNYLADAAWGTLGHLAGGLFKGKALKERD